MSNDLAPLLAGGILLNPDPVSFVGPKRAPLTAGSWSCAAVCNARTLRRLQMIKLEQYWPPRGRSSQPHHQQGQGRTENVFELLARRFGTGGNRMQVRQAITTRQHQEKEDCSARDSLIRLSLLNVMKACNALLKVSLTRLFHENCPSSTRHKPP